MLAVWVRYGPAGWELVGCWAIFVSLMVLVTLMDADTLELSDSLTLGGFLLALLLSLLVPELHGTHRTQAVCSALIGGIVGAGMLVWIGVLGEYLFKKESMGFGDVLLLGAIGGFCGWQATLFALGAGAIIAMVSIILYWLYQRLRGVRWSASRIAFGPWLGLGALIYALYMRESFDAYLENARVLIHLGSR